jgi:predicted 2-oxoglutarate/Fe(II)-dependent dioxygenase YbiX
MKTIYEYIHILPNMIPNDVIDFYMKLNEPEKISDALVVSEGEHKTNDYRKTKWIEIPEIVGMTLTMNVKNLYETFLINTYQKKLMNVEPTQFLRYDVGDKYDEHNDSEDYVNGHLTRVCNRDLSVLCYLNDDYEGGELEFTNLGLKIKPKKGMIITFPSYIEFSHRVHTVTKGTRYSMATWIETDGMIIER